MNAREQILGALPADPLKGDRDGAQPPVLGHRPPGPTHEGRDGLWEAFRTRLEALGGRIEPLEAILDLQGPLWVDSDAAGVCGLRSTTDDVWEARVGFTLAVCAVADTGSVLFQSGPGSTRLGALAPPVHVLLVPRDAIVASLAEGIRRIGGGTAVIATGPSRTADIGGHLVKGVHGPGEVIVVPF